MISKSSDVADFYDEMGKDDDYDQFWTYDTALYEQIHPILLERLREINNYDAKILDLGCGTGAQTMLLCKSAFGAVYSVDISKDLLRICKVKTRVCSRLPFIIGSDAISLPFKNDTFDFIVCFYNVLNHIPRYPLAIGEMFRVLRRGGLLLLEIEKNSMSDLFYGGLDLLLGGRLDYEVSFHEWLRQLKRPLGTVVARWTYGSKKISYWRFSPRDVETQCRSIGFHITQKYGISIASGLIPWGLLKTSSRIARSISIFLRRIDHEVRNVRLLRNMGLNTVYVMEKNEGLR